MAGGTRGNSRASAESAGFLSALSSSDRTALEAASSQRKKDSSWTKGNCTFAYRRSQNSIQYTVYAPIETVDKTVYESAGDDD